MSEFSDDFYQRLKALGIKMGSDVDIPTLPKIHNDIQKILGGEIIANHEGEYLFLSKDYDSAYLHGVIRLNEDSDASNLVKWACNKATEISKISFSDILFLDIETTSLSASAGTFPFLIGVGHQIHNGFRVVSFFMRGPEDERALLEGLIQYMVGFKAVATFNGKTFDLPILKTRCIIHGMSSFLDQFLTIDLLTTSRRLWRKRLTDRSLKALEPTVLQFNRSEIEVPGWLVPEIYRDFLLRGDFTGLRGVIYHNQVDILSLAALANIQNQMLNGKAFLDYPTDIAAIAEALLQIGENQRALELLESLKKIIIDTTLQDWVLKMVEIAKKK